MRRGAVRVWYCSPTEHGPTFHTRHPRPVRYDLTRESRWTTPGLSHSSDTPVCRTSPSWSISEGDKLEAGS